MGNVIRPDRVEELARKCRFFTHMCVVEAVVWMTALPQG